MIDESDDSKSDDSSPDTTVNDVDPAGVLETTPSTETQDNSKPIRSTSIPTPVKGVSRGITRSSTVGAKLASTPNASKAPTTTATSRASLGATGQRSTSLSSSTLSTPGRKSTSGLTASPSQTTTSRVVVVGARPSTATAVMPAPKTPVASSTSKTSGLTGTTSKLSSTPTAPNPRETMRRSLSSAVPANNKTQTATAADRAPVQSLGRKSLSTSTPVSKPVSSSTSTSTSKIGSTAIRKKIGDTDNDSVVSTSSRATTASKIPSRSATPNKTAGSTQRQVSASTPTAAKTPSRLTPSPKSTSAAKPLSGSFSDQSTASTNGVKSARTPVKAAVPKFSHTDSSKSLTRKTSFGSVGSVASATPSVQSTVSSASKARRPSIGGGSATMKTTASQSSLPVKPQKSVDELDEIYSTENVVSSLKAQRVPSAQLLRTTIQRLDTAAVPHTMNPLRRNSLTQSQTQNGTGSNNNSFTNARRDSKSGRDYMNRSFSSTTSTTRKTTSTSTGVDSAATKAVQDNFGLDIKVVDVDDDVDVPEDDEENLASPPTSRSSSLQDLKPLGKPPSATNVLGVKPSPLSTSRPNPFAHRKSYMMPQTPDATETTTTSSNGHSFTHQTPQGSSSHHSSMHHDDGEDLLTMFVNSADMHEQEAYPSPTAPMPPSNLFSRSKSNSNIRFRESPRKTTYPPPYPVKALHPVAMDSDSERACYMPSLVHSTPAAISAIYRAAIAKEAASSQTILGRIASFRR